MREAVIFDVDGVLVDSYRAHLQSWQALAGEHGFRITEAQFRETFGQTSREIIRRFWPGPPPDDETIRRLDARKEALYREIIARDFPGMPGARELIEALHRAGMRVAVGSSGPPENVALVLDRLGCRSCVQAVVTGFDVTRGKPDPEVFLLAAQRLDVAPERCVVIEDAPAGIEAAHRAGMAAAALLSTGRRAEDFRQVEPERVVRSLLELTPELLRKL